MNQYYLTLVLKPDLEEKERKELLDDIEKNLKTEKSKVKLDEWGPRGLSYPIKKQNTGFYVHFEFATEPENVKGLDKTLKIEENLLRYLLVRV